MATSQGLRRSAIAAPAGRASVSLAILVAEDSIITQDLLKLVLTQRGHRVDTEEDGAKALNALQGNHYDVALMDFHLPTIDGLRVVATYKSSAAGKAAQTHFIGITADVSGIMARSGNLETFDLVIAKPIDIANLCSVVENFEHYLGWRSQTGEALPTPVILAENVVPQSPEAPDMSPDAVSALRGEKRVRIDRGSTQILLGNGEVYPCRVLDLSLSGAALAIDERPAIGEQVRVGRTTGRVVRHTTEGIAVEFGK
jgi:CheY-like chemotaxis protein